MSDNPVTTAMKQVVVTIRHMLIRLGHPAERTQVMLISVVTGEDGVISIQGTPEDPVAFLGMVTDRLLEERAKQPKVLSPVPGQLALPFPPENDDARLG